jgi:FAD/FMN-containing dehydrogenase
VSVQSISLLQEIIRHSNELIFSSSKTSTVLPFEQISTHYPSLESSTLVELSTMPPVMEMLPQNEVRVSGAVSWEELDAFLTASGQELLCYPTERCAMVLAGVATSATGERSFGFGPLKEQIVSLKYIDSLGEIQSLSSQDHLACHPLFSRNTEAMILLQSYQKLGECYQGFKNPPTPRLQFATDLMVGFEGQLGPVVEVVLNSRPQQNSIYLFFSLPPWEQESSHHVELVRLVQKLRGQILTCELLDSNAQSLLPPEEQVAPGADLIFLELDSESWEEVITSLLSNCSWLQDDQIFEISRHKFFNFRAQIPRLVNERNQRLGVVKKGSDIQVAVDDLEALFEHYRQGSQLGTSYLLFGHLGDCHLHFNLLPTMAEVQLVQHYIDGLYDRVAQLGGAPFTEHGIGVIKQEFLKRFIQPEQLAMFKFLKEQLDPKNCFFPQGFMNMTLDNPEE